MTSKTSLACCFLTVLIGFPACAQVPYSFTNGQPADADQVNANFTELSAQIKALQTQVAALQAPGVSPGIIGIWDLVGITAGTFGIGNGITVRSGGIKANLTFNSNGTFKIVRSAGNSSELNFNVNPSPSCTPTTNSPCLPILTGTIGVFPNTGEESGTYSVTGNILTLVVGGGTIQLLVAPAGNLMLFHTLTTDEISMAIAIKR